MGILYKLMEYRDDLHEFIKELESKRSKDDLTNKNKYKDLYNIYYNIINEINKIEGENKNNEGVIQNTKQEI